ncbi:BAG family molecular chaperone regulator 5, mitochondrial [Linum perenne]
MRLLLRLDSVPGVDPAVREARRKVSRRIVGMQEILDGICEAKVGEWGGGVFNWDRTVAEMEAEVCKERGGEEMELFCAEYLGFRCFQRFLRY